MTSLHRIVLHALKLHWRGRYVLFPLLIAALVCGTAYLASEFSGRQPATVALDVGLSVLRLCLPFFVAFQMQELITSEFERRYYLGSMTYPQSREAWLLGRFIAVLLVTLLAVALIAAALAWTVYSIGQRYPQGTAVALDWKFVVVVAFLGVDLLSIVATALLLAVFARSPGFVVVGTLGYVLVARSFSTVLNLLYQTSGLVQNEEAFMSGLGALRYLVPDLGALDVRGIALYGKLQFLPGTWPQDLTGAIVYSAAVVAFATWLIRRKAFS